MQLGDRDWNEGVRTVALVLTFLAAYGCQSVNSGGTGEGTATAAAVSIASDASGQKLVMVGGGIWTSIDGGITWTERAPSGLAHIQQWTSVASDSAGTKLVAVVWGFSDRPVDNPAAFSGDIWTSSDGGATWSDQTASSPASHQAWRSVASDASGTKLVAATQGLGVFGPGAIWTSTDAGVTWTNRSAATAGMERQSWSSVGSDATGNHLVAAGSGSGIWASSDGGTTWSDRTPVDPKFQATFGNQTEGWSSIASDATGTKLVASVLTGDVWTSPDGGVTWRDAGSAPGWQNWISVASDSTGTNLVAANWLDNGGDIWVSTNGGLTWTDQTIGNPGASALWEAIASNAAGDHLVAVARGAIWIN
jgi:hypothetical protein